MAKRCVIVVWMLAIVACEKGDAASVAEALAHPTVADVRRLNAESTQDIARRLERIEAKVDELLKRKASP